MSRKCPHGIRLNDEARYGCRCELPGASPHLHGQPPRPCSKCGGETGLHALGCLGTLSSPGTIIVGVDLTDDDFRKLVKEEP